MAGSAGYFFGWLARLIPPGTLIAGWLADSAGYFFGFFRLADAGWLVPPDTCWDFLGWVVLPDTF